MIQKNAHIDELFARKLGNMSMLPPENGWQGIEFELNRHTRNTKRFWITAASIAVLLSIAASVMFVQLKQDSSSENIANVTYMPIPIDSANISEPLTKQPETSKTNAAVPSKPLLAQNINTSSKAAHSDALIDKNITVTQVQPEYDVNKNVSPEIIPLVASSTPVYIDSWDEMLQKKTNKHNRLEFLTKKRSHQSEPENIIPQQQMAIAPTPIYDNIFSEPIVETPSKRPVNRWEVAGQIAPTYTYRNLASVPSNMSKSDFDQAESGLITYSGGLKVAFQANRRFSIQTGVFYSQMGQAVNNVTPSYNLYATISSNYSYANNYIRTSSGNAVVVSNLKSSTNSNHAGYFNEDIQATGMATAQRVATPTYKLIERIDYLEIPLLMRYKIVDRKLGFYVLGGMSTNFLIGNNVFVDDGNEWIREGSLLNTRPINYSGTFGLGLSYQISKNLSIDLEPSFKYYLQSYTTNSYISSNPYAIGVFSGIVYRF